MMECSVAEKEEVIVGRRCGRRALSLELDPQHEGGMQVRVLLAFRGMVLGEDCRSFSGEESGMEKSNGTDQRELTGEDVGAARLISRLSPTQLPWQPGQPVCTYYVLWVPPGKGGVRGPT